MLLALPNPTTLFTSPPHSLPVPLSHFLMAELCELIVALVSVVVAAASDLFTRLFSLFSFLSFSFFISCFLIFLFSFSFFAKFIEFFSANRTTVQARPSQAVPFRFDPQCQAEAEGDLSALRLYFWK